MNEGMSILWGIMAELRHLNSGHHGKKKPDICIWENKLQEKEATKGPRVD